MLTLPDFKEKRILFVQSEYGKQSKLHFLNENIRFVKEDQVIDQVSCHLLFAIFVIGEMSFTTALLKKLSSYGISLFLLDHNLSARVEIVSEAKGNYLLRQKQYCLPDSLSIAVKLVENKITNQEVVLNQYKRKYDKQIFENACLSLRSATTIQTLLGIEGNISKEYFQSLFTEFGWVRRAPRTKEDITNFLLDIGYTYLLNLCDALLRLFGFDTYKGYYHQLFFQRKSLSCDVIEPMRPFIDHQIVKSYHLGQIKEKDFVFKNSKFEFKDGFKSAKFYSDLFFRAIVTNKINIYAYIRNFYLYIMNNSRYAFPQFPV